jgi:hypothetical protein
MSTASPINAIQALLAQTSLQNTQFAANSRYFGTATDTLTTPEGATIVYLQRRFLPDASSFQVVQYHTVIQGERLDNIASQFLGDPTLFWQLCDANNAMRPDQLTETAGFQIAIALPQGITGTAL